MVRPHFDWDDANITPIAEHDVEPDEAEEALTDPDRVPADAYSSPTERRSAFTGTTEAGRLITVVFTRRRGLIRVVTARNAQPREVRRYDRGRR